jgi:hypothetical protein
MWDPDPVNVASFSTSLALVRYQMQVRYQVQVPEFLCLTFSLCSILT